MLIKPLNTFDNCLKIVEDQIKKEKAKGTVDYAKLACMLLDKMALAQENCRSTFREYLQKLKDRVHNLAAKTQDAYADTTIRNMNHAQGALKIISGLAGATSSGIGGFLPENGFLNLVGSVSKLGKVASGATESFQATYSTEQKALLDELTHLKDTEKKLEDEAARDAENAERQRQRAEDAIKEIKNGMSSTARSIAAA